MVVTWVSVVLVASACVGCKWWVAGRMRGVPFSAGSGWVVSVVAGWVLTPGYCLGYRDGSGWAGRREPMNPRRQPAAVEPVGAVEIAGRLGVERQTVDQWRQRGVMPAPRWTVGGRAAWDWELDIVPWALETGRLPGVL